MYDQSFNHISLSRELRKQDFIRVRRLRDPNFKEAQVANAVLRATHGFSSYTLLKRSSLRGKDVFFVERFPDELVLRKTTRNIIEKLKIRSPKRDDIVDNVKKLLSEGISYRVYRLDIKSFFESIPVQLVTSLLNDAATLSLPTKRYVQQILEHHNNCGHTGLPRGIGLSSALSELCLKKFDAKAARIDGVFFYSRFVDDIIFITNSTEDERYFLAQIKNMLPPGLALNKKKLSIATAASNVTPHKPTVPSTHKTPILAFDFLGYKFTVAEPQLDKDLKSGGHFRDVYLDIADSKVAKIKTRIVRSLLSFNHDGNYSLLEKRLKYLTSNFCVLDAQRQQKRLAGIYHNYWHTDPINSRALPELDLFLRKAIISSEGPVFGRFFSKSTYAQRRQLLGI